LHFHAASRVRPEWEEKQMSRFIGFVFAVCLLAIGTSTSVPAASPDWPKSLMLSTTGPGGSFYIFGEKLAPILTEKLGIAVNHMPSAGPIQNVQLLNSGGAQIGIISPAGLERHRLDQREVLPEYACAISNVGISISCPGLAAIRH
jgi:hypothetical protein